MEKPIFLAGYPRSGTTKIYYEMMKRYKKVLYEPSLSSIGAEIRAILKNKISRGTKYIHPYIQELEKLYLPYLEFFGNKIFEILIKYQPETRFVETHRMIKYFEHFRGFHIKDVWISFHLTDEFFKKNWEIYWIIRPPEDIFVSIFCTRILKKIKFLKFIAKTPIKYLLINILDETVYNRFEIKDACKYFLRFYYCNWKFSSFFNIYEMFTFTWIIDNYIAISDSKFKIVNYLDPKLPFEIPDWKPKIYNKIPRKKFENIAKRLGLSKEFYEVCSVFE